MLRQALMAATVILLILLVILTPQLVGVQEDISSLPRLILNYDDTGDLLILFVTSLSGTYLYPGLYLNVTYESDPPSMLNKTHAHGLEHPVNLTRVSQGQLSVSGTFNVEVVAIDRRNSHFDLSLQVTVTPVAGDWRLEMVFGDDQPRIVTSQDLLNAPLATLLQRRDSA